MVRCDPEMLPPACSDILEDQTADMQLKHAWDLVQSACVRVHLLRREVDILHFHPELLRRAVFVDLWNRDLVSPIRCYVQLLHHATGNLTYEVELQQPMD
eukprot:TRINITY_DN80791_c0_g1_i1.p1 TRINITY_DN80791_c0_g1~~TRINITY_DN80791_c0_g1_i1.p1  ORF type:complete len:100 (-),score=15.55 TRINITY_DN80791_c0_g1_i1:20-319(-)